MLRAPLRAASAAVVRSYLYPKTALAAVAGQGQPMPGLTTLGAAILFESVRSVKAGEKKRGGASLHNCHAAFMCDT